MHGLKQLYLINVSEFLSHTRLYFNVIIAKYKQTNTAAK